MNGIAFHVEGIYEKGIPTPTAPQYSILPEVIPSPDPRLEKNALYITFRLQNYIPEVTYQYKIH
jgi:hypothetical protein